MSRSEFYFWSAALLLAPCLAFAALLAHGGPAAAERFSPEVIGALVVAIVLVIRGNVQWHLAWAARVPIMPFREFLSRQWKWLYYIEEQPIQVGALSIWVSKAVTPAQRALLTRVPEALAILAEVQPSRAARLKRLGVGFAVAPLPGIGMFIPGDKIIALDPVLLPESPELMACIVVHEGNHALVWSRGLLHSLLELRTEHAARMDQLVFVERLAMRGQDDEAIRLRKMINEPHDHDYTFRARMKRIGDNQHRLAESLGPLKL